NGFVTRVELIDVNGARHSVWSGTDPSKPDSVVDFLVSFPLTSYLVKGVKITIDTTHVADDWEEIDSVQLHGIAPNHAPELDGSAAGLLTSVLAGAANPRGDTVAALLGSADTDADGPTALRGIAVTGTSTGLGTWQYSTNGGASWAGFGAVSETSAR